MQMDADRQAKAAVHLAMLINMLSIGSLMMVMPLGPDFKKVLTREKVREVFSRM